MCVFLPFREIQHTVTLKPVNQQPGRSHDVAQQAAAIDWEQLENLTHRDPGGRGLASFRRAGAALDAGELRAASLHLAEHAEAVAIVTGFCVAMPDRVTAETDGPPGALYLAQTLRALGVEVAIVTDRAAAPILAAGAELVGLGREAVHEFPTVEVDGWVSEFLAKPSGRPWTHLVSIERPGPSHTAASLAAQSRSGAPPLEQFLSSVPEANQNICQTMRGESIGAHTAPTHRLFELVQQLGLPIATIGIGDGGNELGMGFFAWEDLVEAVATPQAGQIACRVAADFALLGGTSNWAGYALAIAVARLRGAADRLGDRWLTPQGQEALIAGLVAAGAVDGRSRAAEHTVDGLPMALYLEPLKDMLAAKSA
jgi:hypothetical protein